MYELADRAKLLVAVPDRALGDGMLWDHVPDVTLPLGLARDDGTLTKNEEHIQKMFNQLCQKPTVQAPKPADDDGSGGKGDDDDPVVQLGNMKRYKFNVKMGLNLETAGRRLLETLGAQREALHKGSARRKAQQTLAVKRCLERRQQMVETLRVVMEEEAEL